MRYRSRKVNRRLGRSAVGFLLLIQTATGLTGCSMYNDRYRYEPRPAEIETSRSSQSSDTGLDLTVARSWVSVIGVRRADDELQLPAGVDVRLQIENEQDDPVTVDTASFELLDGALRPFGAPLTALQSDGSIDDLSMLDTAGRRADIAPDETVSIRALFPIDDSGLDAFDMSALVLRWRIESGVDASRATATFERKPYRTSRHHHYYGHFGYSRFHRGYRPYYWYHDPYCR